MVTVAWGYHSGVCGAGKCCSLVTARKQKEGEEGSARGRETETENFMPHIALQRSNFLPLD